MLISSLIGLSLIVNEVKASGTTLNMVNNTTSVVSVEETLSEKFQSLYKSNTNASQLNLTANVLEAYQNNKIEFLALTKEEKLTFNQTIKNLSTQAQNIQDEKSLNWIKEINKSAKNINIIWSINEKSPAIDVDLKDMTEAPSSLIVVFKQ
jgi:hypothetical protein